MWDQHVRWMFHTWMNMWSTFKGRWRTKSLDRQLATDVFARETWQWEISKQKGGFNGNIFYKRWIFHWHVRLQPPRCFGLSFCRWLVLHTKPQTTAWFFQKHNGNLSPVHGSNFKTTMHLCRFLAFETQRTLQISGVMVALHGIAHSATSPGRQVDILPLRPLIIDGRHLARGLWRGLEEM